MVSYYGIKSGVLEEALWSINVVWQLTVPCALCVRKKCEVRKNDVIMASPHAHAHWNLPYVGTVGAQSMLYKPCQYRFV